MLEGLHPTSPTHMMRLETSERAARLVADIVSETFDPAETAVAAFEAPDGLIWLVEVFFRDLPDEANVRELVRVAAGEAVAACVRFEVLAERDWVKTSLDGLTPVRAGRFVVHGAHDRALIPASAIGIEIEAALAFGTGHHGTTRGCLLFIDRLAKAGRPRRPLDVGTGTGVLAIALARRHHRYVLASDIDPVSVVAARANARANRAGNEVRVVLAAGLGQAAMKGIRSDLVVANILPAPLCAMATDLVACTAPGARVILSGIIPPHANRVIAAYRARGLTLVARMEIEGWVTLLMRR